jgi:hypothetical protein
MALTTDKWIGTASADWGASSSNWSHGLPTSNSNVEIETPTVLTVSYSGGDDFTVNSLTVGHDLFDISGGSLTITTTASFADGFTQTGGVLTAGGKVTVDGTGTLTGGTSEGRTAFVFDGTVALADYTLGGSTSLSNEKTTNLTGSITLGDDTGVNARIDNEKTGLFNIAGGFEIGEGAETALFVNAGTLAMTSAGESFIEVDFTDTGKIVVGSDGTIDFDGPQNSFGGAISGAGTFEIGGGSSTIAKGTTITAKTFEIGFGSSVTLDGPLTLANTFTLEGATLALVEDYALTLSGTNTLEDGATLDGTGTLDTAKGSTTDVNDFTLGGTVTWDNFGTVGAVGELTLGDDTLHAVTFINEKGATFEFQNDSSIVIGAAFGSSFVNLGKLSVTAGTGTSEVDASVTDAGTIAVQSGTIDFAGFDNSFTGAISGKGAFEIGSGVNVIEAGTTITTGTFDIEASFVALDEKLSYTGTFDIGESADLNLDGVTLTLSGSDSFDGATIDGTGTLVTAKGSMSLETLTLGGALTWENFAKISEFDDLTIGDSSNEAAKFINEKGGSLDFTTDVGILAYVTPNVFSSFVNSAGATVMRNGGTGDSQISVDFTNNGAVIVDNGEIEFTTLVGGKGSFTIEPGAVLQFDVSVAAGPSVVFAKTTGGELVLEDSQGFEATIKGFGFGGSDTDEIDCRDINFTSLQSPSYKPDKTGGVLTLFDGTHTAKIDFFGKYTIKNFVFSNDGSNGTLITDPGSHALLASAR